MTDTSKQYARDFQAWPVKVAGAKPSDARRPWLMPLGGGYHGAFATALRPEGVTGGEVTVCGAPQNNHPIALTKAVCSSAITPCQRLTGCIRCNYIYPQG